MELIERYVLDTNAVIYLVNGRLALPFAPIAGLTVESLQLPEINQRK